MVLQTHTSRADERRAAKANIGLRLPANHALLPDERLCLSLLLLLKQNRLGVRERLIIFHFHPVYHINKAPGELHTLNDINILYT